MSSQWQNFLANLGEWHGTFTAMSPSGAVIRETPSILTLEPGEAEDPENIRMVLFRLRRFEGSERSGTPSSDHRQEYRSLGRQVVFFETGTFCKGSLQVAPGTAFGAELGFIGGDRRHRLVLLWTDSGRFEQLVLIREWRAGSDAPEQPPLSRSELSGRWHGVSATISADWPEPEVREHTVDLDPEGLPGLILLPDGGYCSQPDQVSHRQAFSLEAGWLQAPGQLQRLIRRYDGSGAWQSVSLETLQRA